MSVDDGAELVGALEALSEIETICAKVRESLGEERYVEASGWIEGFEDVVEGLDAMVGLLAAGERNRAFEEEGA